MQRRFTTALEVEGPWLPPGVGLTRYCLDCDDDIALADAAALLSIDETARAARFRFDRDRHRFMRARALLRRVLGAEIGHSPESLRFFYGAAGKPTLDGGPAFNLSHSGNHCLIAVSQTGEIGVDIEDTARTISDLIGLSKRCFTEKERQAIATASDKQASFLAFWTAKEARMKLTGEGLNLDPLSIRLGIDASHLPTAYLEPLHPAAHLTRFSYETVVGALAQDRSPS